MRVTKGSDVAIGMLAVGTVVEDADERQGYFWMQRNLQRFTTPRPKPTNLCVPFAAVDRITKPGEFWEVTFLKISRRDLDDLPRRSDVQPQPTVAEMVRALPNGGASRLRARQIAPYAYSVILPGDELPAATPPTDPFASLALVNRAYKVVAESSKMKLGIIEGMAKAEALAQSPELSEGVKEIMHREIVADYQRIQALGQYTDLEIGRVLQEARQRAALPAGSQMDSVMPDMTLERQGE